MTPSIVRPLAREYPEIGEEPFSLSPAEMEEAWGQPTLPADEKEARACFERIASSAFDLYPEITLAHPCGERGRIDYVARSKGNKIQGLIGFELKSTCVAASAFTDFSAAVAQSVDYSKSRIISDAFECPDWFGATLKWVFMFPCPYRIYENDNTRTVLTKRDWWAQGQLKLAGKFGVGAMSYVPRKHDWGLFLAGHPAFWMKSGPSDLAFRHAVSGRFASGR